jgi:hypothetical protein
VDTALVSTFLYPYPYQYDTRILTLLVLLAIGLPTYGIYRLVIWKMNESVKAGFHLILVLGGMIPEDEVQMNSVSDLYKLLINNQGKEVLVPILRDKKKMMITVRVPEMYVPLKDISFIIF